MEKFKPLTEDESKDLSPMITKIYDIISKKVMNEMKPCDKNNPTYLGGVKFFFAYKDNEPYLMWDTHANEWDETKIMEDIEKIEYDIMRMRGLID
jgi:hypothetical protein